MPTASTLRAIVPILPVRSISHAVEFYRKLGFEARLYNNGADYAFLTRDCLEVHIRRAPDLTTESPSGIYVRVEDNHAAALQQEFQSAGVPIHSPLAPREWRMNEFMLSDPDGNLLRFGEALSDEE